MAPLQLIERREKVFTFIVDHVKQHGYPPSVREVAEHMDTTVNMAWRDLRALRNEGRITWRPSTPRTMTVVASDD